MRVKNQASTMPLHEDYVVLVFPRLVIGTVTMRRLRQQGVPRRAADKTRQRLPTMSQGAVSQCKHVSAHLRRACQLNVLGVRSRGACENRVRADVSPLSLLP